jgi:hypothetical protein
MSQTIIWQGYTIAVPDPPTVDGYTTHPTPLQVISQIDNQFLVWDPQQSVAGVDLPRNNRLVGGTLTYQCWWDVVFEAEQDNSQTTAAFNYTVGVSTSDSDTTEFGMQFGLTSGIPDLPGISAALTVSFKESHTHTISLTKQTSVTKTYTGQPNTRVQVWQLHNQYIAEYPVDGGEWKRFVLEAVDGPSKTLTYPEDATVAVNDASSTDGESVG